MIYDGKTKSEDVYLALISLGGKAKINKLSNELKQTLKDKWKEDFTDIGDYGQILWIQRIRGHLDYLKKKNMVNNTKTGWIILENNSDFDSRDIILQLDPKQISLKEGRIKLISHWKHERNQTLISSRKLQMKNIHGYLFCSICGFSFEKKYGDIGKEIIDIHHLIPISSSDLERDTSLKDLIPVCSNCHRLIHSRDEPYSPEELKQFIQKSS